MCIDINIRYSSSAKMLGSRACVPHSSLHSKFRPNTQTRLPINSAESLIWRHKAINMKLCIRQRSLKESIEYPTNYYLQSQSSGLAHFPSLIWDMILNCVWLIPCRICGFQFDKSILNSHLDCSVGESEPKLGKRLSMNSTQWRNDKRTWRSCSQWFNRERLAKKNVSRAIVRHANANSLYISPNIEIHRKSFVFITTI